MFRTPCQHGGAGALRLMHVLIAAPPQWRWDGYDLNLRVVWVRMLTGRQVCAFLNTACFFVCRNPRETDRPFPEPALFVVNPQVVSNVQHLVS